MFQSAAERLGLWKRKGNGDDDDEAARAHAMSQSHAHSAIPWWKTEEGNMILGIFISISGITIVTVVVAVLAWNL